MHSVLSGSGSMNHTDETQCTSPFCDNLSSRLVQYTALDFLCRMEVNVAMCATLAKVSNLLGRILGGYRL